MKVYRSVYHGTLLSLGMLLTIGLLTANADDKVKTVEVDCTKGKTIAHALEKGNEDKPLVVVVQGTCTENVVIERDDVTLQGNSSGDGVTGLDPTKDTILIDGARRVVIENLTVSGGRHGIMIEGGSATIINSTISGNTDVGIILTAGGNGRIGITNSNQYAGNTISNNGAHGIHITYGASALIGGNMITGNGTTPMHPLFDRSGISLFSATASIVGNNTITGNAGAGVSARSSSLRIGDGSLNLATANTISGNGVPTSEGGVNAFIGTALDIRNATINGNTGNGVSGSGSSVRIRESTISGNIGGGIFGLLSTALDIRDCVISANTSHGVQAAFGTALEIRNTAISGNGSVSTPGIGLALSTRSVARVREGNTIQNNTLDGIQLTFGSGLLLQAPVSVTGNGAYGLACLHGESSYFGDTSGIGVNTLGAILGNCTDFN